MRSAQPKVLFPLLGRSLVSRVLDAARQAGCSDQVVVVGFGEKQVRRSLDGNTLFAVQEGMQGTGQAAAAARGALEFAGRTVVILPGDVPLITPASLTRLLNAHHGSGAVVTVMTMHLDEATGYGRVLRDAAGDGVCRIVEHRDAGAAELAIGEVNTSIYAASGSFLFGDDGEGGALAELSTDNNQQEYLLTDIVAIAAGRGLCVRAFTLDDTSEVAGINDRAQLAALESELRTSINNRWMNSGVSMDNPHDTRIEEDVSLEQDVHLGSGVELRGRTTVASGASIGRGCVLTDVTVGPDAVIDPYVVAVAVDIARGARVRSFTVLNGRNKKRPDEHRAADRVTLGPSALVGPFAHLRQSTHVGEQAVAGCFVEMKKTTLGTAAKANHLSYLGDTEVGERCNIGAGVITCNYDGFAKHKTTIGDDVFVGTDSHLIAPVRLGRGAYVATGTTVTRDVPADALAIGRTRQENKAGYAARLRTQLERRSEKAKSAAAQRKTEPEGS